MLKLFHQAIPRHLELDIPEIEVLKRALRHYGNCVKEKRKVKVGTAGTELRFVLASERKWVCLKIGVSLNSLTYHKIL